MRVKQLSARHMLSGNLGGTTENAKLRPCGGGAFFIRLPDW